MREQGPQRPGTRRDVRIGGGRSWSQRQIENDRDRRIAAGIARVAAETRLARAGCVVDHDPGDEDRS